MEGIVENRSKMSKLMKGFGWIDTEATVEDVEGDAVNASVTAGVAVKDGGEDISDAIGYVMHHRMGYISKFKFLGLQESTRAGLSYGSCEGFGRGFYPGHLGSCL